MFKFLPRLITASPRALPRHSASVAVWRNNASTLAIEAICSAEAEERKTTHIPFKLVAEFIPQGVLCSVHMTLYSLLVAYFMIGVLAG